MLKSLFEGYGFDFLLRCRRIDKDGCDSANYAKPQEARPHVPLGGLLKGIWRGAVPASLRGRLANSTWIDRVKNGVRAVTFHHEDVYDEMYFAGVERTAAESAPTMAETIMEDLQPRTVLDISCGTGACSTNS